MLNVENLGVYPRFIQNQKQYNMEEVSLQVGVNVKLKDGRAHFSIIRNREDLDLQKMREILMGGLSLLIKGEDSNEKQAQAIRDVVHRLQEEFVDVDSFANVWVNK